MPRPSLAFDSLGITSHRSPCALFCCVRASCVRAYRRSVACPSGVDCGQGQVANLLNSWTYVRDGQKQVVVLRCPQGYCESNSTCAAGRKPFAENIM